MIGRRSRNSEPNLVDQRLSDVDLVFARSNATDTDQPVAPRTISIVRDATISASASFEAFYRANRAGVGRALAITVRDPSLAAEAVDEAMARAYERWQHVEKLDNPVGWVYRVGLNWSRSLLRRATRPAPIWLTANPVVLDDTGLDPAVDRALGELSVDQRAVVVCRLLIGYSEAQTAKALGIRPGTVKSRLSRATVRLQQRLAHLQHP